VPPVGSGLHIGVKTAALVASVFVDFPKNRRNFLHKTQGLYL